MDRCFHVLPSMLTAVLQFCRCSICLVELFVLRQQATVVIVRFEVQDYFCRTVRMAGGSRFRAGASASELCDETARRERDGRWLAGRHAVEIHAGVMHIQVSPCRCMAQLASQLATQCEAFGALVPTPGAWCRASCVTFASSG